MLASFQTLVGEFYVLVERENLWKMIALNDYMDYILLLEVKLVETLCYHLYFSEFLISLFNILLILEMCKGVLYIMLLI